MDDNGDNMNEDYESLGDDEADILENAPPTIEPPPTEASSKKAPGFKRKRSKVWTTFKLFTGADKLLRARCSKCGYVCLHDSKNGTENLLKHQKVCENTKDIRQMVLSSSDGSMTMRNTLFDPQEFDALDDEYGAALEKTELDKYLEEKRLNRNLEIDILEYWRTNQFRFPNLSLMARDILSIPISTVASESAFSVGGRILDQYRSSLANTVVESIICTRDWKFNDKATEDCTWEELTEDIMSIALSGDYDFGDRTGIQSGESEAHS